MKLLIAILAIGGAGFWLAIDLFRPLDQAYSFALLCLILLAGAITIAFGAIRKDVEDADSYLPKPKYMAVACLPCLLALGLVLNAALDRSAATEHRAAVVSKSVRATGPSVTVTSWRPGRRVESIPVDESVYSRLPQSGAIEVNVKPGFFGIPWVSGFERVYRVAERGPE